MSSETGNRHDEFEHKYDAEEVDAKTFTLACVDKLPKEFLYTAGPDVYYTQGANVLRHRFSGGAGELTVKRRKSHASTEDRKEVDLRFAADMNVLDVQEFLKLTGWERAFTLMKACSIYWFAPEVSKPFGGAAEVSVVLYDCYRLDNDAPNGRSGERRFFEVELEKGHTLSARAGRRVLLGWRNYLLERGVALGDRVNDSLYEIYSGHKYLIDG
jgi:hypothetical protein